MIPENTNLPTTFLWNKIPLDNEHEDSKTDEEHYSSTMSE